MKFFSGGYSESVLSVRSQHRDWDNPPLVVFNLRLDILRKCNHGILVDSDRPVCADQPRHLGSVHDLPSVFSQELVYGNSHTATFPERFWVDRALVGQPYPLANNFYHLVAGDADESVYRILQSRSFHQRLATFCSIQSHGTVNRGSVLFSTHLLQ